MEEIEMDELAGDSLTLLDYLAHGLFGYIIGVSLYCVYLLAARAQSSVDVYGFTVVWGRYISDIIDWGLLAPVGCAISGLFQAWFAPISYLRYRDLLIPLIIGALLVSMFSYWIIGHIIVQIIQFPPTSPSLSP